MITFVWSPRGRVVHVARHRGEPGTWVSLCFRLRVRSVWDREKGEGFWVIVDPYTDSLTGRPGDMSSSTEQLPALPVCPRCIAAHQDEADRIAAAMARSAA